ncbi:glycine/sarcosine/betaine reductase selenoprotein B family protein [Geopsychrobacter electrodiphilus]|uniref:glycine/sarcosine/betaine reductase selenoprotein B family protein n=1 Tax=Geopsychrobacter electrodiphilus TaxID=225196 RepID=UPI0005271BDE|nr:glycine/sarcosine/betaine reductase selenoprotein B family protein [Geopsychrobacter electrodiphilus]
MARLKNRFLARLTTRFPALAQRFIAAYQPQETEGAIPWVQPAVSLRQAKLALVTTSGIHHRNQLPFDMGDVDGDPSYRVLNGEELFYDFQITHDYYDHTDAEKDPNIIFPLDRLRELVSEGVLGRLAQTHYAFMGHIDGRHIATLLDKTAREVAERLKADEVDLVLLTPA